MTLTALPVATLAVALVAGTLIGLSLGTLGAGGSILAVPVLVHLLGQSPAAATTGSLVVVGVSALTGAFSAWRHGNVMVGRGLVFALAGVAGTAAGAVGSSLVDEQVLMVGFGSLMLLIGVSMITRSAAAAGEGAEGFDTPVLGFRPTFHIDLPRALKILLAASLVGLVTGFLGVGGGFLVVPALVLALGLPMREAAGTSLMVIALSSATALSVRIGTGVHPDWWAVGALTLAAAVATVVGTRFAARVDKAKLHRAFTVLVLVVGAFVLGDSLLTLLG